MSAAVAQRVAAAALGYDWASAKWRASGASRRIAADASRGSGGLRSGGDGQHPSGTAADARNVLVEGVTS